MADPDVDVPANLRVVLRPDPESDPGERDRLSRRLRGELSELSVESIVAVPIGAVPDHAKAVEPATIEGLVLALSVPGGVLVTVIATLRDWLSRQSGRHRVSVTIDGDTVELERATAAQQQALLDVFVRRHSGG